MDFKRIRTIEDAQFVANAIVCEIGLDRTADMILDSPTRHYIVYDGDKKIGICAFRFFAENSIEMKHVCVLKEYRGKGYGKKILDFLVEKAVQNKRGKVFMTVNIDNLNMVSLARKEGYISEGLLMNHYKNGSNIYVFSKFLEV